jgi:dihydroxyacetone kinase DhaKLM complex PTS-EIIA-like component DhaM
MIMCNTRRVSKASLTLLVLVLLSIIDVSVSDSISISSSPNHPISERDTQRRKTQTKNKKVIYTNSIIDTNSVNTRKQQQKQQQERRRRRKTSSTTLIQNVPSVKNVPSSSIDKDEQCIMDTYDILKNITKTYLKTAHYKQHCSGYPKANKDNPNETEEMNCDFTDYQSHDKDMCVNAGGKSMNISVDVCNIYLNVGKGENARSIYIHKMNIGNFNQCTAQSCTKKAIQRMIDEDNQIQGINCDIPITEGDFQKFVQKIVGPEEEDVITKTCKWLRNSKAGVKAKTCGSKKFQLYTDKYLPASRVCPVTCGPYCSEERFNALFLKGMVLDEETGKEVPDLRTCKWLAKQESSKLSDLCWPTDTQLDQLNTMYGYGGEVCTTTCPNTCSDTD